MRKAFTTKEMKLSDAKKLLKTVKHLGGTYKRGSGYFNVTINNRTQDMYSFKSNLDLQNQ